MMAAALLGIAIAISQGHPERAGAQANGENLGTLTVARISLPLKIDDALSSLPWTQAAHVALGFNLRTHAVAGEPTTAFVMTDGAYLYVRFNAVQRETVHATQRTNDVGQGTDDQVAVYLWPDGPSGFSYGFMSNPVGTHYQYSSENAGYSPTWQSVGAVVPPGYTVAMKIPLAAIRGGSNQPWRVEFARTIRSTLDDFVWSYGTNQLALQDNVVLYAGSMSGMPVRQTISRPRARVGVYALAAATSAHGAGFASRTGADISIPVGASASIVAALHPDYSNVEADQQTIAPTAFQRYIAEVRPFFAQGSNFYNNAPCISCSILELYTPAIPTPSSGYAGEGKLGPIGFGAFDAIGVGRDDSAESVDYTTQDQKVALNAMRVAVNTTSYDDDTEIYSLSHDSLKGMFEYLDVGSESGTFVTDPAEAHRIEAGMGFYDKTTSLDTRLTRVGGQYAPADGFVAKNDIAGYEIDSAKTWYENPQATIPRVIYFAQVDRYHGGDGRLDQADNQFAVGFDFQHVPFAPDLWHLRAQVGASYVRLPDGTMAPVSQNGAALSYDYRSADVSTMTYYTGRFGPGRLDSWTRSIGVRAGNRGTLDFEADDTVQGLDSGSSDVQWLERVGYTYQYSRDASVAIGVRRIFGAPLQLTAGPPMPVEDASNVSLAFYRRLGRNELYLVYGDPSALSTTPQTILKFIYYFGAEKGT